MKVHALRVIAVVCTLGAAGLVVASPAGAVPVSVSCGQTIFSDTTLAGPVSGCTNNGIIIGANNITLDLAGFTVSGASSPGDGAGILLQAKSGVTVKNGRVTLFDGGVVIQNGGSNTVLNVIAEENIGRSQGHPPAPSTLYGDGIAIEGSSNNIVRFNTARNNGPYSGIGIYQVPDTDHAFPAAPSVNNLIEGNNVLNNRVCRLDGTCDNDGVRVEPSVSPGNRIQNNTVAGNGLDGISLFSRVSGTYVTGNQVYSNGFFGSASGDGIRVFGYGNYIQNNNTNNNRGAGVSIGRRTSATTISSLSEPNGRNNQILYNSAKGNVIWDYYDGNPNCDNNVWRGNKYVTANQACTTIGGQQI